MNDVEYDLLSFLIDKLDLDCDFEFDTCDWALYHGGSFRWTRVDGQEIIDDPGENIWLCHMLVVCILKFNIMEMYIC